MRSTRTHLRMAASVLVAGLTLLAVAATPALASGAVGDTATPFQLKGVDGKTYSLSDYKGKVVVLEWINPRCPFSDRHARERTMTELAKQHGDVTWLAINSSNPKSSEFTPPAEHVAWNKKNGIEYPVLYDESGAVGHAYGARTTPHMFIIDPQGRIAYNGAIDDDPPGRKAKPERVNYVGHGLDAEKTGGKPDPASTKPYGCTVKY
ncbi:MAG TPA: thioredoxin family protein [Thermoanaerobaculia bacterium]|nr:thioredoxin family protein [Thermoanaerobaculia bacterium]